MALKGLRNLIFTNDGSEDNNKVAEEATKANVTSFPTTTSVQPPKSQTYFPNTQPVQATPFGHVNNEHLDKVVELYQNGFDSLNQAGYDFYEFFQAIVSSNGIDNPAMYQMAMSMGTAMDKSNTKTKLLTQADFYLNEIQKVYTSYVNSGTAKRQELITQKESENHNLTAELSNLRAQLDAITNQINGKESQLAMIDNKYQPMIADIEAKLNANNIAKDALVSKIVNVKNGINNNLK